MLAHQYMSVFSTKCKENINDELFNQSDENAMTDVETTENDIMMAADKLRKSSVPIADKIPAIF